jgi:TatD DNase family protein
MAEIKVLIVAWMYKIQKINHPLKDNPGIFHAFEGTLSEAEELLEFGFKFGVGGPLTYKNSLQKLSVFSSLPVDAICLETDAPYLSPSKHRGERNEPAFLPLITAKLAEIQGKTEVEICNRIFENSYKMFIKEIIT